MAFAASTSAFGMKPAPAAPATGSSIFGQPKPAGTSIFGVASQPQQNTSSNPLFGGGAFGQQNQQQPAGAFGQPAQQPPAAGTGIFGQSTQQPTAGSSIFGQSNQPQQQPAAGASLFGQSTNQPGTSLFGQSSQQSAAGTSLFGQSTQQPAAGSSLFGQSTQQPTAGTSLFGQPQLAQGGQSSTGTSLFGQSQPAAGTSLFGQPQPQQQQQQQQQGAGMFGGAGIFGNNNAASTNAGAFGGSTFGGGSSMFGQKPAQPQQTFGASNMQQSMGPPPFAKTTKFNDLPDEMKKMFEQIDSHIQGRIQISKDLRQRKLGEEATKGQELIRVVHKDLAQTSTTIRNDLHFTRDLKAKADQAVQDTIIATRIVDGFKNPQLNGAYLKDHATFPLEFFFRITTQIRERLVWYKATIEQIERKLSSMANQTHVSPQGITSTVQAQHSTFLALASKTAALDAEMQKIKALYTQLWRSRTGSVRDPFDGFDTDAQTDLGLGGLSVR